MRKYENVSGPIAFISPCIAKRFELKDTGLAQYNVTFKRFAEYMKNNTNYDRSAHFTFDNTSAYCGKIYPRPGGLKDCLQHAVPGLDVRNCEGVHHLYPTLEYYEKASDGDRPAVFDVLSCANGCISGPGTNYDESKIFVYMNRANNVGNEAFRQREKNTIRYSLKTDRQFRWFEKHLKFEDFVRTYQAKDSHSLTVTETDIRNAYSALKKNTVAEQTYDCRACGYESCREMAIAVAKGVNIPENCHQYVVKQSEAAHQDAILAQESVEAQSRHIFDAVGEITEDIEKICGNADVINNHCAENNEEMGTVHKMIALLNQKCKDIDAAIAGIVQVNERYREMSDAISSITEETHILSINASVEAARAGEFGKSFAVVAQEIRSLASNTKDTTKTVEENDQFVKQETDRVLGIAGEIEELVNKLEGIMNTITSNVAHTSQTGEYIKGVAENIRGVTSELRGE